jgi:stage IV sporulation protein B
MDGQPINDDAELATAIDRKGADGGTLTIMRHGKEMTVPVQGILCQETGRYRIGLYVRDGVVGVGTLTCWDPNTHRYAALGHIIVDADTHQGINVLQGRVVSASVETVKPGKPGLPGEKIGVFNDKGTIAGTIEKNSAYGIFGKIEPKVVNALSPYEMEVAYAHQVKPGSAEIWTVVNGEDIEKFAIEIEKVFAPRQIGKDMIIRVTDPRLLSLTGGIIQGMSGSPIVQEGHLAGAVTHVFLNDPATGYGIYMDNILYEMNSSNNISKKVSTIFPFLEMMNEAV